MGPLTVLCTFLFLQLLSPQVFIETFAEEVLKFLQCSYTGPQDPTAPSWKNSALCTDDTSITPIHSSWDIGTTGRVQVHPCLPQTHCTVGVVVPIHLS